MSNGKYEATFKLIVRGFSISAPAESVSMDGQIRISLGADGDEALLVISLDDVSEEAAAVQAERIAISVHEWLLLDLGNAIEEARPPRCIQASFKALDAPSAPTIRAATGVLALVGGTPSIVRGFGPERVSPILDRALLQLDVEQPAIAGMLYASRKMFRVAMETDDAVASFLICYSALSLAALFKLGRKNGGGQKGVDLLLMTEDASIRQRAVTRTDGTTSLETPWTEVRNQFVHAEDRGADPESAAKGMSTHLASLRDLTARILRKM